MKHPFKFVLITMTIAGALGLLWVCVSGRWVWIAILLDQPERCEVGGHVVEAHGSLECEKRILDYVIGARDPALCDTTYVYHGLGGNPDGSDYRFACRVQYSNAIRDRSK